MSDKKNRIKPWEELTITDDYMFKLVMKHPRICQRLIEKILKIKIKHLTYLEDEKTLKSRYEGKGIRGITQSTKSRCKSGIMVIRKWPIAPGIISQ